MSDENQTRLYARTQIIHTDSLPSLPRDVRYNPALSRKCSVCVRFIRTSPLLAYFISIALLGFVLTRFVLAPLAVQAQQWREEQIEHYQDIGAMAPPGVHD